MRKKRLLLLLGSMCLALVLVMLPLMSSCAPEEEEEVVEEVVEEEEVEEVEEVEEAELPVIKVVGAFGGPASKGPAVRFREVMEEWDELTPHHKIVFEPHYMGEMFPGAQNIEALASGAIQVGGTFGYAAQGFEPRFAIFNVPLLFISHEHIQRFLETPEFQKVLADHERAGAKATMVYDYYMWLYFREKEVHALEDIAGMRIRCMESPTMVRSIELLGANPISVVMSELTFAMQTGMIDGLIGAMSPSYIKSLGYLDYMKTALCFPITFTASGQAVNTGWWYSLPDEVREVGEKLFAPLSDEFWGLDHADQMRGEQLVRETAIVTELTEAEFSRWDAALRPLFDEVGDEIGHDLIDAALRTREG